jgi:hypothetical protein
MQSIDFETYDYGNGFDGRFSWGEERQEKTLSFLPRFAPALPRLVGLSALYLSRRQREAGDC